MIVVSEALGQIKINLTPAQTNLMRSGSITVVHDALGDGTSIVIATAMKVVVEQKVAEC